MESRKDNKGRVLRNGESQIKKTLAYMYRYNDLRGERKYIYDNDLNQLRKKEKKILAELANGINRENFTLNEQIVKYFTIKKKWDKATRENYLYYYNHTIKNSVLGNMRVTNIKKSDVLLFYSDCSDNELSNGTIAILHKIIHPALQLAVDDDIIRKNPSDSCTKEYPQEQEVKYALTISEEKEFMDRLKIRARMTRYIPFYAIMKEVGLRISEIIGLTWNDVDFNGRVISINHQLLYRSIEGKSLWYWKDSTKTVNGMREIPMTDKVYNLLRDQQKIWLQLKKDFEFKVDGHGNFVFLSHMTGRPLYPASVRRMMDRIVSMNDSRKVKLPDISPHILRHTACTRFAEAGMDIKTIQYIMGQVDVRTTMQCYNHVDVERAKRELDKLGSLQENLHQILHQIM